ncbi:MAG: PIN domain-containing protein [Methanocellales archaeon]|nr:PIN domain-containing protein [Methanocellales archaeon]MDI6902936.1 PIN domain-containing protein [Methanocellales archaeon]
MLIVDAFAWVEFIIGSDRGRRVKKYIEGDELITLTTTLSELKEYALRNNRDFDEILPLLYGTSRIVEIDEEIGIKAGETNYERKKIVKGWGMMDSHVLASSVVLGARILTGDQHFRDVKNAIMV